jgi:hypothetical protein
LRLVGWWPVGTVFNHERRRLICVLASNRDHAKGPVCAKRDGVTGPPRRYDGVKRWRVRRCPVLVLESVGEDDVPMLHVVQVDDDELPGEGAGNRRRGQGPALTS